MRHSCLVVVVASEGLAMLPCTHLVELTRGFEGSVRLSNGSQEADCKSVIELMLLAAPAGTELCLTIDADECQPLANTITKFFEAGFTSSE